MTGTVRTRIMYYDSVKIYNLNDVTTGLTTTTKLLLLFLNYCVTRTIDNYQQTKTTQYSNETELGRYKFKSASTSNLMMSTEFLK